MLPNFKIHSCSNGQNGRFWGFKWTKLISRKIWVAEKFWNFHIVYSKLGCPAGLYIVGLASAALGLWHQTIIFRISAKIPIEICLSKEFFARFSIVVVNDSMPKNGLCRLIDWMRLKVIEFSYKGVRQKMGIDFYSLHENGWRFDDDRQRFGNFLPQQ